MKRMMLFLMVCCLIGWVQAAYTITNGDFELNAGPSQADVDEWFDKNTGGFWNGAWQSNDDWITPNDTQVVVLTADNAGTGGDPLAGDSYLYQSIGTISDGSSLGLSFDWGHPDDVGAGRVDTVIVSVFASDGTFVPNDDVDIYGAAGVTLLDSASYTHTAEATGGEIWNQTVILDLSGASAEDEIFLRFNSGSEWPVIDNVQIIILDIVNVSPPHNEMYVPVSGPENNLVFTVNDPNIVIADVYFSVNDPNASDLFVNDFPIGPDGHAPVTKTINPGILAFDTDYYWKVIGYEPNTLIPANGNDVAVIGPTSHFKTSPETPVVTQNPTPAFIAVPAGEDVVVTAKGINGDFQWLKDGSPIATTVGVYDITNVGSTSTLTIYDVQLVDEGDYTLTVTSLVGTAESEPARVMIHRQTSYYNFEATAIVDGNDVFVDAIDGYPAVLMSEDVGDTGLPTVTDANQADGPATFPGLYGVRLDNPYLDGDPNGQYLQIYPGVIDYEDITVALWVMPKQLQEQWSQVYNFGDANGDGPSLFLNLDHGATTGDDYDTYFDCGNVAVIADLDESNWVAPGTWHYVAITIGGGAGRIFIDGLWYNTGEILTDPIDLGAVMNYIGKSAWSGDDEWNGLIDELKIWNYARTNEQIAQEYMAYTGVSTICNAEENDVGNYDDVDMGGNGNCQIDLPDFAGMAARWLEDDNFHPAP